MADHIYRAPNPADERPVAPGTPTQVANPRRTTIRTAVQAYLPLVLILIPLLNSVLIAVADFLANESAVTMPAWVFAVVNGGVLVTGFIIALTARVMAVPGVADFIARRLPFLAPIRPTP